MVSHIRLENTQNYKQQVCLSFMTGLYGCRWKRYQRSTEETTKFEKAWVALITLSFAFIVMFLYYWVMAKNDIASFNRFFYESLGFWFDWFILMYALTILTLIYVGILLILAVAHGMTGRQIYLHWVHKVPIVVLLLMCVTVVILLSEYWPSEWVLVAVTLQVTAPILQIIAVVTLTILAWPLAGLWWRNHQMVCRCVSLGAYILLLLFVYLSPLIMRTPCIVRTSDLPRKPPLLAHRGAEEIAPENTVISFETAANYSVYGFETDVRISLDGVPFLMHDPTLARTTNVDDVFPNRTQSPSENFTWAELQELDAGSWFLERDPFRMLRHVPKKTREKFKDQRIPSFVEFLKLAINYNTSILFDVFEPPDWHDFRENYTELVLDKILSSQIPQEKVWWLQEHNRSWVEKVAPEFVQTASWDRQSAKELLEEGIINVNVGYSNISTDDIRTYRNYSITTNIYTINTVGLYSVYWCEGAHTITTSACQDLYDVQRPIWHMTPIAFLIVSVVLGVASAVCVTVIFFVQRCRHPASEVNPESISLHSPRHFTSSTTKKSDRELLYRTNEDTMFSPTHAPGVNIQQGNGSVEEAHPGVAPPLEEEEPPLYQEDMDSLGVSPVKGTASTHQEVRMQLE